MLISDKTGTSVCTKVCPDFPDDNLLWEHWTRPGTTRVPHLRKRQPEGIPKLQLTCHSSDITEDYRSLNGVRNDTSVKSPKLVGSFV